MDHARTALITIPSTDMAFRRHVESISRHPTVAGPEALETRLRRVFPRVLVRERDLSGEAPAWYVYRDGRWTPPERHQWWAEADLPRVCLSLDGWLVDANPQARGLLGISLGETEPRYFTDFVAPGALDDAQQLLGVIRSGHVLTATVLVRPTGGEVIGCDLHASRSGDRLVAVFRLADDIPA